MTFTKNKLSNYKRELDKQAVCKRNKDKWIGKIFSFNHN